MDFARFSNLLIGNAHISHASVTNRTNIPTTKTLSSNRNCDETSRCCVNRSREKKLKDFFFVAIRLNFVFWSESRRCRCRRRLFQMTETK